MPQQTTMQQTTMQQTTLSLVHTGIGKKALVAVTGAILFGFVITHLLGNLQVFLGAEHLNAYAASLRDMPKVVWSVRAILLVALVVHVALTVQLAMRNRAARRSRYAREADLAAQGPLLKYARKTMILSGPIVFAFIAFHLAHLTIGAEVVPGYEFDHADVYANVVHGFRVPWITGLYVFANILLGFHLYHGGHSLLQSLGLRSPRFDREIRGAAIAFAALVSIGNVIIPFAIALRLVGGDL
jgi:succinate dehydrogenase / fumarate reductase cytochrome b subunit